MKLTEDEIIEFQKLFKKRFGFEITREDAIDRATRLVNLIYSLYLTPESKKMREKLKNKEYKIQLDLMRKELVKYKLIVKPKSGSRPGS